jgi:hypothetical protein
MSTLMALEQQKEYIKSLLSDLSKERHVRGSEGHKKFVKMQNMLRQHVYDLNNRIIEAKPGVVL